MKEIILTLLVSFTIILIAVPILIHFYDKLVENPTIDEALDKQK